MYKFLITDDWIEVILNCKYEHKTGLFADKKMDGDPIYPLEKN
jgi:hypothetical protein